jgi:predicted HAD superfamily phosphohydrolase YqeG
MQGNRLWHERCAAVPQRFLVQIKKFELDFIRKQRKKFASELERAIKAFGLDRERPLGVLGQQYTWLETAARNCAKVQELGENL